MAAADNSVADKIMPDKVYKALRLRRVISFQDNFR
jgi:hypothetical protein